MAEPSVEPLVPHLFLLSLTLFSLPPLSPLPPVFQLDGVDGLGRTPRFVRSSVRRDGPAAALRWDRIGADRMGARVAERIGIGSDPMGWAPSLRHGYMARLSMVGVPFHRARSSRIDRHDHQSVSTLPFGLAHTTTKHALRV